MKKKYWVMAIATLTLIVIGLSVILGLQMKKTRNSQTGERMTMGSLTGAGTVVQERELYTLQSIESLMDEYDQVRSRDFKLGDCECLDVWVNRKGTDTQNVYSELGYYIFDSEEEAGKAYTFIVEKWFGSVVEQGDTYIQGWLSGVCDASIEEYVQLCGNMIVVCEVQVVSEWICETPEDESPASTYFYRIDFIREHFQ